MKINLTDPVALLSLHVIGFGAVLEFKTEDGVDNRQFILSFCVDWLFGCYTKKWIWVK
jgi:hypothetical protein